MSELSITKKEMKKGLKISLSDGLMALMGCCAGLGSQNLLMTVLIFCVLGYFFQKSLQQFFEFLVMVLVFSSFNGSVLLYQNILLILFFSLLVLFGRVIHISMFHFMPFVVLMSSVLAALVKVSSLTLSLQAGIWAFVLMKLCSNQRILIRKEFVISDMIFSVLSMLVLIALKPVLSFQQLLFLSVLLMCVSSFVYKSDAVTGTFVLLYLLFEGQMEAVTWLICGVLLHFIKEMKGSLAFFFPCICALMTKDIFNGILGLLVILVVLSLPERSLIPFLESENEEHLLKMRLRNKEQLLQHYLNQFSHVFDLIADYYESSFEREVQFLKGMSISMSQLSLAMKQCALSQEDEAFRIMELLKGYRYDVLKVHVTQSDAGSLRILIDISDCLRKDVDDVVLPLLQMNINQHLKVISVGKAQKFSSAVRIELASSMPLGIRIKAFRSLDENRRSGDTCAVFQSGNQTICSISDGMGQGESAEKTSGFVTHLTQRLLSCRMPIEMIVKCINTLCTLTHSEHFATLDFMCLDAMNHRVVMAKNGAVPSYLLRDGEIIKIEGHSLPLGIVHQINADCFQMDIRSKDILLMCSDGAEESMIQSWLSAESVVAMKQEIEKTCKQKYKKDDISVIVAEIL